MKVINLYAGPGAGKSLQAAAIFCELKKRGKNCELVTEYAKDKYWDKHEAIFENQIYIFAKQLQRIRRLEGRVDYVVTDSPLLLQKFYYMKQIPKWGVLADRAYLSLVGEIYKTFDNLDIILERNPEFEYQQAGRYQNKEEAEVIDERIKDILVDLEVDYHTVMAGDSAPEKIIKLLDE